MLHTCSLLQSSVFAGATFQRMSQGMRGVMTNVGKSRLGDPASTGGRKQGSEAGIGNVNSSRLWNWLQKAEAATEADGNAVRAFSCTTVLAGNPTCERHHSAYS
jgi:hypothetical protein